MPAPRKNYDKAVELYKGGMSAPQVAKLFGIANSGIYKILKRRGCEIRDLHRNENSICSVPGCGEPLKARGLCSRHTYQLYKHGKVISAEKLHDKNRICSVPGCGRKHRSDGYCTGHLGQFRKHGEIISNTLAPRVGILNSQDGYVYILRHDHPAANKDGYVKRANLVWEENTGRVVALPALIHHKNGIKNDDSFSNLEYFASDLEHQKAHHVMKGHRGFIAGGIM